MKKYTFQSERDVENKYDCTNIILTVESDSLTDIIQGVEYFLRANGFTLANKHIDIVEDDE